MSGLIPAAYSSISSGVAGIEETSSLRLLYSAFAANGTVSAIVPQQARATARQWLLVGNATTVLSSATAQAICANPDGSLITAPQNTQRANLAAGMVHYFAGPVAAPADSTYCIGFAIGGLSFVDVLDVRLINTRFDTTNATTSGIINVCNIIKNQSTTTILGGFPTSQPGNNPLITLNGSNAILEQDQSTAIAFGTNTLCIAPAYGVVFGALQIKSLNDSPLAGDLLELLLSFYN